MIRSGLLFAVAACAAVCTGVVRDAMAQTTTRVLCQRKSGALFVRVGFCAKRETPLNVEALSLVGPTGPAGPQGAQGPQGLQGLAGATGERGQAGSIGPAGPSGPTGKSGVSFAARAFQQSARVDDDFAVVSAKFALGPGRYVLIGKLYVAQSGLASGVNCELRQRDMTLDFASAVLTIGMELPITLVSTAVVEDESDDITIACRTDVPDTVATAIAVQLVGISVDQVSGP
jgi:Collagen triple helix repeat (20 copies)